MLVIEFWNWDFCSSVE